MSTEPSSPRIVVTVADPSSGRDPEMRERKNRLYADGVRRAGGTPLLLDAAADPTARAATLAAMDGLLLSGGADIDPARYGRKVDGATDLEPDRDALEAEAFAVAERLGVPVLGICRGHQAINVFSGGSLTQHVDGHQGPAYGSGPAGRHDLRIAPGSRLAAAIGGLAPGPVNTYHHQAIATGDLATGLVASAWSEGPDGELVEGLEAPGPRFVVGIQCHPERQESTPAAFEGLWRAFVAACRAAADARAGDSLGGVGGRISAAGPG